MGKFTFTPFDKAIVAAILTPILGLLVNWAGGGQLDEKSVVAAVAAGLLAGLSVYAKGNAPATA